MKNIGSKILTLLAGVIFLGLATAQAQNLPLRTTFANTGTAISTTNSHFVIPIGDGHARVTYISATSDKAGSVLQWWKAENGSHTLTIATNSGQAIVYVPDGTKYAANDTLVIRHKTDDSYERRVVSSQTATSITLTANLTSAIVAGDSVWKMTTFGSIPVGAATKELTGGTFYNAPQGRPVLVELDSTSAGKINLITGLYN